MNKWLRKQENSKKKKKDLEYSKLKSNFWRNDDMAICLPISGKLKHNKKNYTTVVIMSIMKFH